MFNSIRFVYIFLLIVAAMSVKAQKMPATTMIVTDTNANKKNGTLITIESADRYQFRKLDTTQLVALGGNVFVQQGKTKFYADSVVLNQSLNMLEAFGKIHINDADSIHTYASYLKYLGKEKKAYLNKDVKLTDGKSILTTQELVYDVNTKIGSYYNGGKVVNGKTILTSTEGYYYGETKDVYFKKKVQLNNPESKIFTDTLLYNTASQIATFVVPTTIISESRTVKTKDGFYDMKNKKAQLGKRSIIDDSTYTFVSDDAVIDDKTGLSQYHGNAIYRSKDTANGFDLIANDIKANKKTSAFLATEKPILFIKNKRDTTFITADTLFSGLTSAIKNFKIAVLNDSTFTKDSTKKKDSLLLVKKNTDTTSKRFFEAYHHVKIFSDSVQAICDSLFFSGEDSVFRLFQNPVLWAEKNQITGDTIFLYIKKQKPHRLSVFENAMSLQEVQSPYYNQVKSTTMQVHFINGQLQFIKARGSAETVYYGQDEANRFTAVNKSTCDVIDVYFEVQKNGSKAQKIVLRNNVNGTAYPMRKVNHNELRLRNFRWLNDARPKSRFDIFSAQ